MNLHAADLRADHDDYLVSRPQAWFAFAMTFALMLFDYIDRQVIVSLFPHLKTAWALSDKQLGALVSVIASTSHCGCSQAASSTMASVHPLTRREYQRRHGTSGVNACSIGAAGAKD